jgi:hypothetical protein
MPGRHFGAFVSGLGIPFPGNGDWGSQRLGSNMELLGGKTKHLMLLGPFGGLVGEAGNAHAMRQPTLDCRFDEIGCKERERDRHVDLAGTTPFAFRNPFGGARRIIRKLVEPTAPASNRCNQCHARFRSYRTSILP